MEIARTQGENFAKLLNTFHRGLEASKEEENVKQTKVVESVDVVEESAPVEVETEVEAPKPVVTEPVKVEESKAEEKKSRSVAKPEAKKESKCFCM